MNQFFIITNYDNYPLSTCAPINHPTASFTHTILRIKLILLIYDNSVCVKTSLPRFDSFYTISVPFSQQVVNFRIYPLAIARVFLHSRKSIFISPPASHRHRRDCNKTFSAERILRFSNSSPIFRFSIPFSCMFQSEIFGSSSYAILTFSRFKTIFS